MSSQELTRAGQTLGTLAYMAPEQIRGTVKGNDPRIDLYSAGVSVFLMLTARRPIDADDTVALLQAVLERTPLTLQQASGVSFPPALEAFVERALRKDPTQRYQTALEMRDALVRAAGSSGMDAVASLAPPPDDSFASVELGAATVMQMGPPELQNVHGFSTPSGVVHLADQGPPPAQEFPSFEDDDDEVHTVVRVAPNLPPEPAPAPLPRPLAGRAPTPARGVPVGVPLAPAPMRSPAPARDVPAQNSQAPAAGPFRASTMVGIGAPNNHNAPHAPVGFTPPPPAPPPGPSYPPMGDSLPPPGSRTQAMEAFPELPQFGLPPSAAHPALTMPPPRSDVHGPPARPARSKVPVIAALGLSSLLAVGLVVAAAYVGRNHADTPTPRRLVTGQPTLSAPAVLPAAPSVAPPVPTPPVVQAPVVAQPAVAQPVVAHPVLAQPVAALPAVAQPVVAQPLAPPPAPVAAVAPVAAAAPVVHPTPVAHITPAGAVHPRPRVAHPARPAGIVPARTQRPAPAPRPVPAALPPRPTARPGPHGHATIINATPF